MKVNSRTIAGQLARKLDNSDKCRGDGKIEASVWNAFIQDKGGKSVSRYINLDAAIRSLVVYLCRQAKNKGKLITAIGQEWLDSFNNDKIEIVDDNIKSEKNDNKNNTKTNYRNNNSEKKVDTSYSKLSREKALKKAKNDSRLEKLDGGVGWSVSKDSFETDIPYARKHTGQILSFVASIIGENITVTSALGTAGTSKKRSPHRVTNSYCTHHNAENPKLDIKTNGNANRLSKKLKLTGLFSRVAVEPDHLDIQIKNEVYLAFEQGHNMQNILACAKNNNFDSLLT